MKKIITLIAVLALSSLFCVADLHGETTRTEEFIHEPIFNSKIYLHQSGRKHAKSVVLVHGTGEEGARVWKDLIPELEKKYHVVAFDLPGFARSSKDNKLYSPKNFASFIDWIVKKYTKGCISIIGHSMGGAISLYYAQMYPSRLERLVVVSSAGILYRSAFTKSFISIKPNKWLNIFQTPVSVAYNYMIAKLEELDGVLEPETVDKSLDSEFLRRKLYGGDPEKIASIALLHTDFSGIISTINIPTLIIWGEKDSVSPLRTGRVLEWMIPGSELRIMPDVGHSPMLERPHEFNKIVTAWLSAPPQQKERKPPLWTSEKVFLCEHKDCIISDGEYDRIEIRNSNQSQIMKVAAKHIHVEKSIVSIESTSIKSEDVGVKIIDSVTTMSGCSIDANIGLLVSNSSVDLAGVKITGKTAAVKEAGLTAEHKSTVILSVSKLHSPFNDGYKHEIKIVTDKNPY